MANVIDAFFGEYKWLSNFEPCPIVFEFVEYPSVEHAYQAAKTLDTNEREQIRQAKTPGEAKGMGARVTLRPDWETIKLSVMFHLVLQKFSGGELRKKLLATEDAVLIEGNTWYDTYWGRDVSTGKGYNHLGQLLMLVRSFNIGE